MRAYARLAGSMWEVVVEDHGTRHIRVVKVVSRHRTPRAAVEEARRWNSENGQPW